jgi:5-methylcytosine-specific restriction protein A
MPTKTLTSCRQPGCPGYAQHRGFCEKHQTVVRQRYRDYNQNQRDPVTTRRLNSAEYKQARIDFLRASPLCALCLEAGRYTPASVLDHIAPHGGDAALFWDQMNWQGLCNRCHGGKTGEEKRGTP